MCYVIKRNNKRYNNFLFDSYEQARSYIRKKLRNGFGGVSGDTSGNDYDPSWTAYSNPSHSKYGFSIERRT